MKSIAKIHSNWLRRGILIAAALPLLMCSLFVGAMWGALDWTYDGVAVWLTAWRAKR